MKHDTAGPMITGTNHNDSLVSIDGIAKMIAGWAGDDTIIFRGVETGMHSDTIVLSGDKGNDTFFVSNAWRGQIHLYGGSGDDTIFLDVARPTGAQALTEGSRLDMTTLARHGVHVYGDSGSDIFDFVNTDGALGKTIGRIDDFDPSRDKIRIDGTDVTLDDLPSNARVISHQGQQWLLINDRVLYTLDGARLQADGDEELHFIWWPTEWENGVPASADVSYVDPVNFVPYALYEQTEPTLNAVKRISPQYLGTDGAYFMYGRKTTNSSEQIHGKAGNDVINGVSGHDTIHGGAGRDLIAGGLDNDDLYGGRGADQMWGGSEHDQLVGGSGSDRLWGNAGRDTLYGENGNDRLAGDVGNDLINGDRGADKLFGGGNSDQLMGGRGADSLYGGMGADRLNGGAGNDRLIGGAGADTFIFDRLDTPGRDVIVDFQHAQDQLIFHATSLSFRTLDTGVMITTDTGHQVFVMGCTLAQINDSDWMII